MRRLASPAARAQVCEIAPRPRDTTTFPVSLNQQWLWFQDQLEPGNPTYNIPIAARLRGPLDVQALAQSLNCIVERHEILRTTFESRDGEPVQVIGPVTEVPLPVVGLEHLPEEAREHEVNRLAVESAQSPFDLVRGPVLRVRLLRLRSTEHVLLVATHHIVSDAWSGGVFLRELAAVYSACSAHQPFPLSPLPIQYADFANWQRQRLRGDLLDRQIAYWKRQLHDPSLLMLPMDAPRPPVQRFRGARHAIEVPMPLHRAIVEWSAQREVTVFMTLLAVFATLLHQCSGQTDILIGSPVAGRTYPEVERLIGMFVNTLVLRIDLSGRPTFEELVRRVRATAIEAYAHQEVPFERVVEALQPRRSLSHNPIFQVMFTFLNEPSWHEPAMQGVTWSFLQIDRGLANRDLTIRVRDTPDALIGHLEYNTDLFQSATTQTMVNRYLALLTTVVSNSSHPIDTPRRLSQDEARGKIMPAKKLRDTSREKLAMALATKPVIVAGLDNSIETRFLDGNDELPLVISATISDVDLAEWTNSHSALIQANLSRYGGILFRNFDVHSASDFERVARGVSRDLVDYQERSTPRTEVQDKIYTSTEYPADQHIMLHNEMAYARNWPLKICFYCAQPALQGGETPVADSRRVLQCIDPNVRRRFADEGVMYVRNFSDDLDLGWQEAFQTTDRLQVESYCRQAGIAFEWRKPGRLRTRQVGSGVSAHPLTNESVWFNAAHMFHVAALDPVIRESLQALYAEEDLPRHAYYGDGSRIEPDIIEHIRAVYQACAITFPWQQGDVLVLDNMLSAHGRRPYEGRRSTLVCMGELVGANAGYPHA